jgi:AcrR family transcriptional regulator
VTPRPYTLGKRQAAAEETRSQIVAAARDLLGADAGAAGFSIDAVARAADVARMTVYHRFGSRAGLLEALFDDLAERGELARRLPAAFAEPEPLAALDAFVSAFGRFWSADRLLVRRLNALAVLDPEIAMGNRARQERGLHGARVVVGRLAECHGRPDPAALDEAATVLWVLTGFETFDALAGPDRSPIEVVPLVQRLVRAAFGFGPDATSPTV